MFEIVVALTLIIPIALVFGALDIMAWKNLGITWENSRIMKYFWRVKIKNAESLTPNLIVAMQDSEFLFPRHFEQFKNQKILNKILKNTIISLNDTVVWQNVLYSGLARQITLFFRFWTPIYVCDISIVKIKYKTSQEIAKLIVHEIKHHYLKETTGNYWGGEGFQPDHTHDIWKNIK